MFSAGGYPWLDGAERIKSQSRLSSVSPSTRKHAMFLSKTVRYAMGFVALFGFARSATAQESNQPPAGFTALFNGKDLAGWHGRPHFDPRKVAAMSDEERKAKLAEWTEDAKKHWSVDSGELINDGHGAYLTTDAEYGDIELLIDYKTVPKADSGIYIRGTPQIQIWDHTKEGGQTALGADKGSGGLWNNSPGAPGKDPLVLADKPFGEWNRFRIIQVGARTTVYLNDQLCCRPRDYGELLGS